MKLKKLLPLAAVSAVVFGTVAALAGSQPPNLHPVSTAHLSRAAASGFAVVNSDGSLARALNATASSAINPGEYEVDFPYDVSDCAFTATTGLSTTSGSTTAAVVTVAGRAGNKSAVYVQTYDPTAATAAFGFHLIVTC